MSSIRDQIIDAAVLALNTSRPVDVPAFERLRTLPFEPTQLPANTVYASTESVRPASNRNGPTTYRLMTLIIELRLAENEPDKAADPTLVWITATLNTKRLRSITGQEISHEALEQLIQWRLAMRERPHMAITVEIEIPYSTRSTDQTAAS